MIRRATEADIPRICAIYAYYVLSGTATFETDPPDRAELAARLRKTNAHGLPWLVDEDQGVVTGYAYAGPYRLRPAYRFTLEDSIYIDRNYTGRGIGTELLSELLRICGELGYRQMVAVIGDSMNHASVALHAGKGFRHVGTLTDVGYKFERWLDCVLMQRELKPAGR